jgi:hypothetical protein
VRILLSEGQLENLKKSVNKDIDERSRSFAFTRKKDYLVNQKECLIHLDIKKRID